jgi:hypothetical protein
LLVAEAPPNADGSAVVVRPHPDSRIFMTVVRAHGSKTCDRLSKAVRNRALEICMRCVIDYADRFADLMEFGASLSGSIQILEWAKEYRSSNQAIAALPDRLAYRLATQLDQHMLTVRTMHLPRPSRAAFAVSAMMLILSC